MSRSSSNRLHQFYLGLWPSLVYLATTYYLTPLPDSAPRDLWVWLDGPLFPIAAQRLGRTSSFVPISSKA